MRPDAVDPTLGLVDPSAFSSLRRTPVSLSDIDAVIASAKSCGVDAPALFMSGYPGGCQPRPGDGFMAKPFSRLQLVREVRQILDA